MIENCSVDDTLLRHRILFLENDFDYEKIIESAKDRKVLVICNSISKATEVYLYFINHYFGIRKSS